MSVGYLHVTLAAMKASDLTKENVCLLANRNCVFWNELPKPGKRRITSATQNLCLAHHTLELSCRSVFQRCTRARGQVVRQVSYRIIWPTCFGYVFQIQSVCLVVCMLTVSNRKQVSLKPPYDKNA